MKKLLLLLVLLAGLQQANAQCPYTYTISGNTVAFNAQWAIIGTQTVDSVVFNFGDGSPTLNATTMPTLHTYAAPGFYTACITRYISTLGQPGQLICNYCDTFTIGSASSSCFVNGGFNSSVSGLTVNFTNTTTCTSCTSLTTLWDYGDGSTSTMWQQAHTYAIAGTYTVCQYETGTNPNNVTCIDTTCSTVIVSGSTSGCTASLSHTISGSTATFTPTVTGGTAPFTYFYNYGDGNSGASNVHTYAAPGIYNACVTVTGANSNTCTACDSGVTVVPTTTGCSITAAFTESITGLNVNFTNNSTITNGNFVTRSWIFGDGGTSAASSPTYSYTAAGTYTVTLVVTGMNSTSSGCADSTSHAITVGPSGINSANLKKLNVYPNPTSKNFIIEIPTGETLESLVITDVAGRKIATNYSIIAGNKASVSLEKQSFGIYFIKLQTNQHIYTSSIMKQD